MGVCNVLLTVWKAAFENPIFQTLKVTDGWGIFKWPQVGDFEWPPGLAENGQKKHGQNLPNREELKQMKHLHGKT